MSGKWRVFKLAGLWWAQPPLSIRPIPFDTHASALGWATQPFQRLEYWLEHQR